MGVLGGGGAFGSRGFLAVGGYTGLGKGEAEKALTGLRLVGRKSQLGRRMQGWYVGSKCGREGAQRLSNVDFGYTVTPRQVYGVMDCLQPLFLAQ